MSQRALHIFPLLLSVLPGMLYLFSESTIASWCDSQNKYVCLHPLSRVPHSSVSSHLLLDLLPMHLISISLKTIQNQIIYASPPTCYFSCVYSLIAKHLYWKSWGRTPIYPSHCNILPTLLNSILQISLLLCWPCPRPVLQHLSPGLRHLPSPQASLTVSPIDSCSTLLPILTFKTQIWF